MNERLSYVNPPLGDKGNIKQQMTNDKLGINQKILHRLQIAKGHLEKVISMHQKGEYCVDIVHQSLAVQAALKKVDEAILKNHLETCVAESIKKGNSRKVIAEVVEILEKK